MHLSWGLAERLRLFWYYVNCALRRKLRTMVVQAAHNIFKLGGLIPPEEET